jgi:pimeloyl-ACP methyl ester carboxylesterase
VTAPLAHDERGNGSAIVLIHGHPFNRRMWSGQLDALSDQFRVVAPDLPGYGESPARSETITPRGLAEAVVELMDALDVERATVVGLSLGGLVAMELGLGYPDRVDGLVLTATTAAPLTPEEAGMRRSTAARIEEDGMLDHALEMAGRLFGPAARRDPRLVLPILETMLTTSPAGAAAALRGRAERPPYDELLRDLRVPALVLVGDADFFSTAEITAQLVAALPDPEVVILPEIGHMPNLEAPERFDDALRAFTSSVAGSRRTA